MADQTKSLKNRKARKGGEELLGTTADGNILSTWAITCRRMRLKIK